MGAADDREPPVSNLLAIPALIERDGVRWAAAGTRFFIVVEDETAAFTNGYYRIDGESPTAPPSEIDSFRLYDGPFFLPAESHVVYFFGEDVFGNREAEVRAVAVRVDLYPPATTFRQAERGVGTLTATDTGAGVAGIHVSVDDGPFTFHEGETASVPIPAGTTSVRFYAVDLVGNAEAVRTVTDLEFPVVEVFEAPGETVSYRASPTASFAVTDTGSGVDTEGVSVVIAGAPPAPFMIEEVVGPWTNGPEFDLVVGQADLDAESPRLSADRLGYLDQLACGPDGSLWVADAWGNNRVVRFSPPFATGMPADIVLGQPDFTTNTPAAGAAGMNQPSAIAFDGEGRAHVADFGNNRILRFSPPFANGMAADLVLGQPDFVSTASSGPLPDRLGGSGGVAFGPDGRLYATDWVNNRVLIFEPPFETGEAAVGVLGAPNLSTREAGPDARRFSDGGLWQLDIDDAGRLYVADATAHRVLVFEPPFENGEEAVAVIGQPDFTSAEPGIGPDRLNLPWYVHVADDGRLYVGDWRNNRYLVFDLPVPETGARASAVIGQPDFFTTDVEPGSRTRFSHRGTLGGATICDDGERLFVAQNVRVLGVPMPEEDLRVAVGPLDLFDVPHGGEVAITVQATDRAGNGPAEASALFTVVDDVPPTSRLEVGDSHVTRPSGDPILAQVGSLPTQLRAIDVSPDGTELVYSNYVAAPQAVFVRTSDMTVTASVRYGASGNASGAVYGPDGRKAYVVDAQTSALAFIDVATKTLDRTVTVTGFGSVGEVLASPDGRELFLSASGSPYGYAFVDAATGAILAKRNTASDLQRAVWSPDGTRIYATSAHGQRLLHAIDATTREVIGVRPIPGGANDISIDVTPDGTRLVVPLYNMNSVMILPLDGSGERYVPLAGKPHGVDITPDGRYALISLRETSQLAVLDLVTETVLPGRTPTPVDPWRVRISPLGDRAYTGWGGFGSSGYGIGAFSIAYPTSETIVGPATPLTVIGEDADQKSAIASTEAGVDTDVLAPAGVFTLGDQIGGPHTIDHRATDAAGNASATATDTLVLDDRAPVIFVSEPAAGRRYLPLPGSEVRIAFYAADDRDPTPRLRARLVDAEEGAEIEVKTGDSFRALDIDDGFWNLVVEAEDFVGNRAETTVGPFEVVHDALPPRTGLNVGSPQALGGPDGAAPAETFVTGATPFTLSAVDDLATVGDGLGLGVAASEYAVDAEAYRKAAAFTLTGHADGAHAVSYRSIDVIGNLEATKVSLVHADNAAPVIDVEVGSPSVETGGVLWVSSTTPIDSSTTDAGVGLATFTTPALPLTAEGPATLTWTATDRLGHTATATLDVTVDDAPPEITVTIGAPRYDANGVTYVTSATPITATATDAGVGLASLTGPTFPLAEGPRTLTWTATDHLGNVSTVEIAVVVDNTPPTTTLTVDITDTTGTVLIPESLITLTAVDGPAPGTPDVASGVASTTFTLDGETTQTYTLPFTPKTVIPGGLGYGPHTLAFSSIDNLGNSEAETTFAFTVSPALEVSRRIDHSPRVLLWWNTGETPVAAVEAAVASAALDLDTVTAKDSFVSALRTGAYNLYVLIGEAENLSAPEAEELAAHVDAGEGLVAFEYDRIDGPMLGHDLGGGTANVARDNVLGVRVAGKNGDDLVVSFEGDVFEAAGRADRVREVYQGVEAPGAFTSPPQPETPAITLRRYGAGTAIYVDFAAASTPADVLGRLVDLATPETQPIVPGGVVVLAIDLKSLVVPLDLTVRVEEILPAGVTVLDVRPAPASQQPNLITWYVVLDVNEDTTVGYSAAFPAGTTEPEAVVAYNVRGSYHEFGRFGITIEAASRAALASSAADSMLAFAATLPTQGGDRQRVEQATADVAAIENAVFATSDQVEDAIGAALDAIEAVTRTEDPAGESIRALLDALVATLGREWIALGGQ